MGATIKITVKMSYRLPSLTLFPFPHSLPSSLKPSFPPSKNSLPRCLPRTSSNGWVGSVVATRGSAGRVALPVLTDVKQASHDAFAEIDSLEAGQAEPTEPAPQRETDAAAPHIIPDGILQRRLERSKAEHDKAV